MQIRSLSSRAEFIEEPIEMFLGMPTPMTDYLGTRLKECRQEAGLTQVQLAMLLDYNPSAITRWEGNLIIPDIRTIKRVVDIFARHGVSKEKLDRVWQAAGYAPIDYSFRGATASESERSPSKWLSSRLSSKEEVDQLSCFISHASGDGDFSERLYGDLQANDIVCWHYTHDMRGGREWEDQISDAIKSYRKLIIVCSRRSIYRPNVVSEILRAIDEERRTGEQKLFPIRLDDHILGPGIMEEAREKVRSGEWRENWVYYVRKYHILDFSIWKDEEKYQHEFIRLVQDLRTPPQRKHPT